MASTRTVVALLLSTLASLAAAQQGVLVNGNSNLPSCAQGCQALQQAAQACPGGTSSANQQSWVCFCQSAYLTNLKTASLAAAVCSSACTSTTDNSQVATWYNTNCGSDYGASEHAADSNNNNGQSASTSSPAATVANTATVTASNGPATVETDGSNFSAGSQESSGDWWTNHYKWIIMLIVLAICLPLLAFFAICLKRRHDRKQDQVSEGFNAGITHRTPHPMSDPNLNASGGAGSAAIDGSGRNSPARTRDAFMPYGYGYDRSESRLGSKQAVYNDRRSPLATRETPLDPEKEAGMAAGETPGKKKSKRVLVRERSAEDSIDAEKR